MGSLIRTDLNLFTDRVDEITASTNYEEVKKAIATMKTELVKNSNLVCLCAPQVGYNLRIFVVKTSERVCKAFLNPLLVSQKGLHLSRETNPCFENKSFIIPRSNEIHLAYQEPNGQVNSESYIGAYAEVIQQMVQMLDGILLSDYGLEIDSDFDEASDVDREAIVKMYLDHLNLTAADFNKQINDDPELKNMNDTIKFMTGLLTGEIKPIDSEGNEVTYSYKE